MAQELKVCEAYICHNEFSHDELPQKKDAIVKSASHKEEDDWWDYAAKIECYRKEDADKVIAELKKERDWLAKDRAQAYDDLEKRAQLNIKQEESIRHHKYKRCLALHDYCLGELEFAFRDPCIERSVEGCVRWRKWANLWLKLADKFKEGV